MSEATQQKSRILSLDQFRGYTVLGMILVNFVGGFIAVPAVLKHNNTYFSYADTIMPSFLFACGMSYRLSARRRMERDGVGKAAWHVVIRSLALVLVSLALYGPDLECKQWAEVTGPNIQEGIARLFKASLWEVLAIIGMAQLITLPVIAAGAWVRLATAIGFVAIHAYISHTFNFHFVYGKPNAFDPIFGAAEVRAWDGGLFGLLMWSAILLSGTLAMDVWERSSGPLQAAGRYLRVGVALMLFGYATSCLSPLYDRTGTPVIDGDIAASPLIPPSWGFALGEAPFMQPPKERPHNYWMMNKRVVTVPFTTFSTGFSFALLGLFAFFCDGKGLSLGIFRTFGRNALLAYILHHMIGDAIGQVWPKDSPFWFVLLGALLCIAFTYVFIRALEKRGVNLTL